MQIAVPPLIARACEILSDAGFQAYVVGGAIRDSLLGLEPTHWDIATDARPEQVEAVFERAIPTGKEFGTITVILEGNPVEITTMRRDGPYSDGRRPDYIILTDRLKEDLSRRDFTVNARPMIRRQSGSSILSRALAPQKKNIGNCRRS